MQLVEPTHGEACCRRCVPAVSFHLLPHSPYRPVLERERNAQVDRCLGRIARAASAGSLKRRGVLAAVQRVPEVLLRNLPRQQVSVFFAAGG